MSKESLGQAEVIRKLAENLSKSKKVTSDDNGTEQEAWTLAHGFSDLEDSFRTFSGELLPKLLNENLSEEEIDEVLWEIGEEFRHILYHIHDNQYFSYCRES